MSGVLLTSVVGSYPQPDWLIDRDRLGERLPPRVRARELWRVEEAYLEEAQDDATRIAVRDMERAGVDVITDGEMRRESYSNRFATALDGVDLDEPGVALDRTGHENPVPRVVGPIRRTRPVEVRDVEFLRSITDRRIKITVPGPFTMTQQAQNDHYDDDRSLALAYAEAVNEELRDLKAAGADVVQIDEPYLQARPEPAREYALEAINRALDGIEGETVLHTCFGYAHIVHERLPGYPFLRELAQCDATHLSLEAAQPNLDPELLRDLADKTIVLGVLDLGSSTVETSHVVADRIRRALTVLPPERLVLAPDCGMKYLSRETAFRKLEAMVAGARAVREELAPLTRSRPSIEGFSPRAPCSGAILGGRCFAAAHRVIQSESATARGAVARCRPGRRGFSSGSCCGSASPFFSGLIVGALIGCRPRRRRPRRAGQGAEHGRFEALAKIADRPPSPRPSSTGSASSWSTTTPAFGCSCERRCRRASSTSRRRIRPKLPRRPRSSFVRKSSSSTSASGGRTGSRSAASSSVPRARPT